MYLEFTIMSHCTVFLSNFLLICCNIYLEILPVTALPIAT